MEAKNTYFLGEQLKAEEELSRLIEQARYTNKVVGDLLPLSVDESSVKDALDIGSGSGDWCLDLAQAYPTCKVIGIDNLPQMITYAKAQAECRNLTNVEFQVMNALQPDFPEEAFDLISSRFSASFITSGQWPHLIKKWRHILRPGGTLSITEQDVGYTNSRAFGQLLQWIVASGDKRGANFGGPFSIGAVAVLPNLLEEAHFTNVQTYPYYLNVSARSPLHERWLYNATSVLGQLKPLFLRYQIATEQEFTEVFRQAQEDFQSPTFCHATFILNITGVK